MAAPGKYTSEFWLTAGTQGAVVYIVVEPTLTWSAKIAAITALTVQTVAYTLARTWIKKHTGYELPDLCGGGEDQPAVGPSADPLPPAVSPKIPPPPSSGSPATSTTPAATIPSVWTSPDVTLGPKR